ncbi:amidohydrolase family protein [Lentzea californiensis]|uniref:amidohydrolase family protein n=1 Tax=Lentzea californiensis TaxID=438851 RepID=UPI002166A5C2|nr:amidohydrolase family protein [Lentzea californiensis]MCR3752915.1 Imidazolonepropionase [Lentzea californiensis]
MCAINRRGLLKTAGLTAAAVGSSTLLGACAGDTPQRSPGLTAITNARIFDGERVLDQHTVLIEGGSIAGITGTPPSHAQIVDAAGATLLPGLIDSHVHTSEEGLRDALLFGVTTELEMQGGFDAAGRKSIADRDDLADVRSAGFGLTAPGGHPSELVPDDAQPDTGDGQGPPEGESTANPAESEVTTPEEAIAAVRTRVEGGSDFIKIMIEDGHVLGAPGLPMMSDATVKAAVLEARRLGKLTVAHTLTVAATEQAVAAGMDGLAHLFIDRPHTPQIIENVVRSGVFVTPCLCLNASIMGRTGAGLAADPRVGPKLSPEWLATLNGSLGKYPQGDFDAVLATVAALHTAGVDVLVGTDVSVAWPELGGMAHGASVHHEMQLLVQAGLTPVAALKAATSTPARRFGLLDRGRIAAGARADLLLVEGDPTTKISDSLSIKEVWRRGVRQARK